VRGRARAQRSGARARILRAASHHQSQIAGVRRRPNITTFVVKRY
jgi:hypothetical protein